MLDHATKEVYRNLRTHWGARAQCALAQAKARMNCETAGVKFEWFPSPENPRDVFGDPDPINGPFYDPESEFFDCIVRSDSGEVIASLGMIDDPFRFVGNDPRSYSFCVECELATEAWEMLQRTVTDSEDTLP